MYNRLKQKRFGINRENSAKAQEEIMNMNTNMKKNNRKELTLDELEQVNGGILPILLGVGTIALGGLLIAVMDDKKKE